MEGLSIRLIQIPLSFAEYHSLFIRPLPCFCSSAMTMVPCLAFSWASWCAIVCVELVVVLCTIVFPIHFVLKPHLSVFSLILSGKIIIRYPLRGMPSIIYSFFFYSFLFFLYTFYSIICFLYI